jgi:hypothetical protein
LLDARDFVAEGKNDKILEDERWKRSLPVSGLRVGND